MLEDRFHGFAGRYLGLPSSVRTIAGSAYGALPPRMRYGSAYSRCSSFLDRSEWWSAEELDQYSWERLRQTIWYAYRRVPWYGRIWAEYGISPADISSPADLHRIPLTRKEDIVSHPRAFLSVDARPRDVRWALSSGSTGTPARFAWTTGLTKPAEAAFIDNLWRRVGYDWRARVASLRGRDVRSLTNGRLWLRDPTRNRWIYSSLDLDASGTPAILGHMIEADPHFIHAYPSTLTALASFICAAGCEGCLKSLRAVLAGSEESWPWQLDLWRRAFGPDMAIMRWYGCTERAALAGSCEDSESYHVYPQYSFSELVPEEGEPSSPGDAHALRIVGTSFDNWVMPLIRYDTGDLALPAQRQCACGRAFPLFAQVLGRSAGWAQNRHGDWVPFTQLATRAEPEAMVGILRFQFVQTVPGELTLLVVPAPNVSSGRLAEFANRMARMAGDSFTVRWEIVDSVDALPGGKRQYFLQRLPHPGSTG